MLTLILHRYFDFYVLDVFVNKLTVNLPKNGQHFLMAKNVNALSVNG